MAKKWECWKCKGNGTIHPKMRDRHNKGATLNSQFNEYDPVDCDVCGGRGVI